MNQDTPRVGVGVIVVREGLVLLGLRQGSHGAGTWALPGGHLEFGESVEACAARELGEETGLLASEFSPGPYANDLIEGRHYVTLFVVARGVSGEPQRCEPQKCAEWRWCSWHELPRPLFAPLATIQRAGYVPAGLS